MQDNINKIISNALVVNKDNLSSNIKEIINSIYKAFIINKDLIIQTNKIDKKNQNGYFLDFDIIANIFTNIKKEKILYGNVTISQKDNSKKIIYGKEIFDYGTVVVINDGNPYVIIEMALRNILAGNNTIFVNTGFMYGTNNFLIQLIQTILEKYNISKNLVQLFITKDYNKVLSNYANIDLVICIGKRELQNFILSQSKIKTIVSGYESFDLYVDDGSHLEILNKIVNLGVDIKIYINKNTKLNHDDAIFVDDIDEAIAQINYTGNKYSSAIFTNSTINASRFIKEIKSKIITINTSPTIERIIDINQRDLVNEKTIIYPLSFKFDGNNANIILNEKNSDVFK